jgi:hypothetical protein
MKGLPVLLPDADAIQGAALRPGDDAGEQARGSAQKTINILVFKQLLSGAAVTIGTQEDR